jgi:16S rRNA processing protein RimM
VAQLAGVSDRDQAALLKGREISVPRSWLPEAGDGQVYWADLIGLQVRNEAGDALGEVAEVFSNGGHDVLRVAYASSEGPKEFLVPLVGEYILEVDVPGGVIRVDWQRDW